MSRLNFTLEAEATGSAARAARFKTLSSEVLTPLFMPVGTHATVRHQNLATLKDSGSQILLANTYHLHLRPGPEVFEKMGGIHKFTKWSGSFLTDSGGFQIFSLPNDRQMSDEGARFRSYVDGSTVLLSPERSIKTQVAIGSDIMMVLDQCIPSTSDHAVAKEAMELTHRWALRSLAAREDSLQSMFAIVQGACFEDLRKESAAFLTSHPFDGFAIGGLAVGESKSEREDFCELAASLLPRDRPRYLMGVGTPIDLLEAVHRGVDMFDCILPTALAAQGVAYTSQGRLRIGRGVYKFADQKLDENCGCPTCNNFSRSYLHHLTKVSEPVGVQLIGAHNLYFYHQLMREMREAILNDTFKNLYREKREELILGDQESPAVPPQRKDKPKDKRKRPSSLGDYELQVSKTFTSIRHIRSGEVMHSVSAPDEEAKWLYIDQSRLCEKLQNFTSMDDSLVLWDVGLGAAHNAMAAVSAAETIAVNLKKIDESHSQQHLRIFSFENDLDSLRLALKNPQHFAHIRHAAPNELLRSGKWNSSTAPIEWTLLEGDFLSCMNQAPSPHIIFYDPFSLKTNSELWSLDCFQKILAACESKSTELFNYTASTAVRATLLAAGFSVAKGIGTGPKSETTIAVARPGAHSLNLLCTQWLQRWERSDAKHPATLLGSELPHFEKLVREHVQFN